MSAARSRHQHAFEHRDRKVPVDRFQLRNVGDPQPRLLLDSAGHWLGYAQEQSQQGGLTRARWANYPGELVFVDVQVDVVQNNLVVVTRLDIGESDQFRSDSGCRHCG